MLGDPGVLVRVALAMVALGITGCTRAPVQEIRQFSETSRVVEAAGQPLPARCELGDPPTTAACRRGLSVVGQYARVLALLADGLP